MSDVRAIAYYLPQFHPIPENDRWWGKGFTEWANVTRAKSFFAGHQQPQLPTDLGFYDLRVPEVRAAQAELARAYGVHGFCYYYYWFGGRRLLERPLDEVVRSGQPDFPFCICWVNENWTRRWDGGDDQILMEQVQSAALDRCFIESLLPMFCDPRYIQVRGAPLLLVYRADRLLEPRRTTEIWREAARRAGISQLHLCAVLSYGFRDPTGLGFDSGAEFPPHQIVRAPAAVAGLSSEFRGGVFDYEQAVQSSLAKPPAIFTRYRGVMTAWDNTPRRGLDGEIFAGATPAGYERWLREVAAEARKVRDPEERIVFINAWNEWAEGAHLEPDQRNGHAWLEATARALFHRPDIQAATDAVREQPAPPKSPPRCDPPALDVPLSGEPIAVVRPAAPSSKRSSPSNVSAFRAKVDWLGRMLLRNGGRMHVDAVAGKLPSPTIVLPPGERVTLSGWAFAPGIEIRAPGARAYLVLRSRCGRYEWAAPLGARIDRADVVKHFGDVEERFTANCGFAVEVSTDGVPPGMYELGVVHTEHDRVLAGFCVHCVIVP